MKRLSTSAVAVILTSLSSCSSTESADSRTPVEVARSADTPIERAEESPSELDRRPVEVAEVTPLETGAGEAEWLPRLRRVCEEVGDPKDWTKRQTDGWEPWKDKLALTVVDARLHSPAFKTWGLASVDDPAKWAPVRHAGPFFGLGLTIEVENTSTSVLQSDDIYVWATLETNAGQHTCFADAKAARSWDPFAKKGAGGWVTEKSYPEWPFRPKEKKRYVVYQPSCFSSVEMEGGPKSLKVEVYSRFRPLGGELVIAGPLAVIEQAGDTLRAAPLAEPGAKVTLGGKKPVEVRQWAVSGDQVLVDDGKKASWVPYSSIVGMTPGKLPTTVTAPDAAPEFNETLGTSALIIKDWQLAGWRTQGGAVALGHKVVSANVAIAIDSSAFQKTMDQAVADAQTAATTAAGQVAIKQAEVDGAKAVAASSAGTESETAAKDTLSAAEDALAEAVKAQKAADGAVAAASKALASGLAGYLKAQAAQVDCGSFLLDVGRAQLKPRKGSFGSAECKALLAGTPVAGVVSFDLERWDTPVALVWKGSAGLKVHLVASKAIGDVPAE